MTQDPRLRFWARPEFVFSAIFVYLAAHFAIRVAMPQALSVDDSDQALFTQTYAWAYRYKAPPLFAWMLGSIGRVVPVDAVSIGLLRYTLLAVLIVFVYLTARRLLADPRLAALSVYGFAAINIYASASHRNLAHSTALGALVAVAWYVFARLAASPRLGWYLALGAVFGLGMLAKWNFLLFAVALPLACLFSPAGRRLVLTWKIVPAALLAALIVLPTAVATVAMGPPPGESVRFVLDAGAGPRLAQIAEGTLRLLDTALVYSLNFLVITLLLFARPLWRGLRAQGTSAEVAPQRPDAFLVGMTIAVGLAICWALVLFLGATEFKVRYLYQTLLIMPVWFFMLIERGRPSDLAINVFALLMVALVVIVGVKRVMTQFTDLISCGLCLEMRPFDDLAAQIRQAGYAGGGTILSDLGTLRVAFPQARVINPSYPRTKWPPPSGEGQCLFVWQVVEGYGSELPATHAAYLADELGGRLEAPHADGLVSAPMLYPAAGEMSLAYRLYDGPNGDCR